MNGDTDFYQPQEKTFGQLIQDYKEPEQPTEKKYVILSGFPYDEGTKRNGGRVGGAVASSIIRKTLKERDLYLHQKITVFDAGDIEAQNQLEKAHQDLQRKHQNILRKFINGLLICIGGSNDQSFCNVCGLMKAFPSSRIGVINLDSHFDVRPLNDGKAHSGSPFRLMLENPIFKENKSQFVEFAVKGATCSNEHYKFLQENGCKVYWMEKDIRMLQVEKNSDYRTQAGQLFERIIKEFEKQVDIIFVSFDIDCISSRYMPGVSAPSVVGGINSEEAIEIVKIAGRSHKVKMIDFSEFNPAVESILSSRLISQMIYSVVSEFSERSEIKNNE